MGLVVTQIDTKFGADDSDLQAAGTRALEMFERVKGGAFSVAAGLGIFNVAEMGIRGVTEALKGAVETSTAWATRLNELQNNTGMTDAALKVMDGTIQRLGANSSASFQSISDGLMHVANFGFQGANATTVMEAALRQAVSTGGDAAKTGELLANTLKEYNLSADKATQTTDILTIASQRGNSTFAQFAETAGKTVGVAANLHVPLDQVAAALSALTQHGYNSAAANTGLTNVLTHLIHPAAGVTDELKRLSKVTGTDLVADFSAAGLQSKGLTGVMADLHATYSKLGLSEAQAAQETMTLLNAQRGGLPMATLLGTGAADYAKNLSMMADVMSGKVSPSTEAFKRTQETLGFQMGELKNRTELVAKSFGDSLSPALAGIVKGANELLASDAFGQWVARIQGWITVALQALGILAQGFGDALGAILQIVVSVGQLIYAALSWINPFATHSPSLVSQVTDGVAVIEGQYAHLAQTVPGSLAPMAGAMRDLQAAVSGGMAKIQADTDATLAKHLALLGGDAPRAYKAAETAMAGLQAQATQLDSAIKAGEAALQPYQAAVDSATAAVDKQKDSLEQAQTALRPYEATVTTAARALDSQKQALDQATTALRPYEDAVTTASRALDTQKQSLEQAQTALRPYEDAVSRAQRVVDTQKDSLEQASTALIPYEAAVTAATRAVEAQKDALTAAQEGLRGYEAAVTTATRALQTQKDALADAQAGLRPYQQAVQDAGDSVADVERQLRSATAALAPFQDAVAAAQAGLATANEALQAAQEQARGYSEELKNAQAALQGFQQAPLEGQGAFSEAMFQNKQQADQLQLALNNVKLSGGSQAQIAALQKQLEDVRLAGQNLKLQESLQFDPLRHQLEALTPKAKELTFEEAKTGAQAAQTQIGLLQEKLAGANLHVIEAQAAQRAAKEAVEGATAAYKAQQAALIPLQTALLAAKAAQDSAKDSLTDQQRALQPYQDAVSAAQEAVERANRALRDQQDALQPLKDNLQAAQDAQTGATRALTAQKDALTPYTQAVTAAQTALNGANRELRAQQDTLTPLKTAVTDAQHALDDANRSLKIQQDTLTPYKDAVSAAQHALDDANRSLKAQQDTLIPYKDALQAAQDRLQDANRALKDHKAALDPLKAAYKDVTDQMRTWQSEMDKIASAADTLASKLAAAAKAGKGGPGVGAGAGGGDPLAGLGGSGAPGGPDLKLPDFSKIKDDIVNNAQKPLDALKLTIGTLNQPLLDMASALKGVADSVAPMKDGWDKGFGPAIIDELSKFSTYMGKSWTDTKKFFDDLKAWVGGLDWKNWDAFVAEVKVGVQQTSDTLDKGKVNWNAFLDEVKIGLSQTGTELGKGQTNWQAFTDELKVGWDQASRNWTAFGTEIAAGQTNVQTTIDGASRAWTAFGTGLKTNWDSAATQLTTGWDGFWTTVDTHTNGGVTKLTDRLKQFGIDRTADWGKFTGDLQHTWDSLWSHSSTATQTGTDGLSKQLAAFGTSTQQAWDKDTAALKKIWDAVWPGAQKTINQAWIDITKTAQQIGTDVGKAFSDCKDTVLKGLSTFATDAAIGAVNIANGLIDGLLWLANGGPAKVGKAISDLLTGLIDKGKEVLGIHSPSTVFSGIGKSLVDGLIHGLDGAWAGVMTKIRDLAQGLPQPIKDLMGIKSPSTVWAELGHNLAQGLAQGVTAGQGTVQTALGSIGKVLEGFKLPELNLGLGTGKGNGLADMAKNLIDGLTQGLQGQQSAVNQQVDQTAGGVVTSFRQRLGIASPSTVTAEMGVALLQGLQQGLQTGLPALITATQTSLATLPPIWQTSLAALNPIWDSLFGPDAGQEGTLLNRLWGHQATSFFSVLVAYTKTKNEQWFSVVWAASLDQLATKLTDYLRVKAGEVAVGGNEIGKQIVAGIAQGIIAGTAAVEAAAAEAVRKAIQAARDAGVIKSPSQAAAALVGAPLVQGVAQGILGATGGAVESMRAMVVQVLGAGAAGISTQKLQDLLAALQTAGESGIGAVMARFFGASGSQFDPRTVGGIAGLLRATGGLDPHSGPGGRLTPPPGTLPPVPTLPPLTPLPPLPGGAGTGAGATTNIYITLNVEGLQGDLEDPRTWDRVARPISVALAARGLIRNGGSV